MWTPWMPRIVGGAALCCLVTACGGSGDSDPPNEPEPLEVAVELGTGEAEFEPIEGEPTLEMAAGFQGGFHVWLSVLGSGFEEDRLDMTFVTEIEGVPGSLLTLHATQTGREVTNDEGEVFWTFAGFPGQVRWAQCAHGKRVRLQGTLSDSAGNEATDEKYCIVSLAEQYRDEDCW